MLRTSSHPQDQRAYVVGALLVALVACGSDEAPTSTGSTTNATGGGGGAGNTGGAGGVDVAAPDPTQLHATGSLGLGRSHHTATLLPDGRVVVVGGETAAGEPSTSVEIFDPEAETWSDLPALPVARSNHTTTLLEGGALLIVGGGRSNQNGSPSPDGVIDTALLYDPAGGGASSEIPLGAPRSGHQALLLPDGDVLVVGGSGDQVGSACTSVPNCYYGNALASAERYAATTGAFSPTGSMAGARMLFGAVLLLDGTPLLVGGATDTTSLKRVETFAASNGTFAEVAPMAKARFRPVVVTLGSGAVVAAAGKVANVGPVGVTEIYDPSADQWAPGPDIGVPRTGSAGVTLESGNALVVGGFDQTTGDTLDEVLIFDAKSLAWLPLPPLAEPRALPTATVLQDGRVLVVGGAGGLASCEIAE